ncbi:MAG: hypothetical protein L3K07_03815 [Thermoplasmata archaeon]|nr:hypothetical protein [Thermoplasmata archaeon]
MTICPVCDEPLALGSPTDAGTGHPACLLFMATHRLVNGTWHAKGCHCPACGGL